MIYIYCPCYTSIIFALYLRDKEDEITILTNNKSVKKFCVHMEIKYQYLGYSKPFIFLKDLFAEYKERGNLNNLFERINPGENDTLYFDGYVVEYKLYYLIKKWASKGKIFNTKLLNDKIVRYNYKKRSHPYRMKHYIKKIKSALIIYIIYGVKLKLYVVNEKSIHFGIDEKFKERHKINFRNFGDYKIIVKNVIKKNLMIFKEYDTLIISAYPHKEIDYSIYNRIIREIPKLSSSIGIKIHPTTIDSYNFEDKARTLFPEFDIIPSFIPVELILPNVRKNVISESSTALIAASEMPHLKVICILNLANWIEKKKRFARQLKSFLAKNSNDRITFVNNISQLKRAIQ